MDLQPCRLYTINYIHNDSVHSPAVPVFSAACAGDSLLRLADGDVGVFGGYDVRDGVPRAG